MRKARTIRKGGKPTTTVLIRRKNLLLDQAKIDRAKRILGASTETETIHRVWTRYLILKRSGANWTTASTL